MIISSYLSLNMYPKARTHFKIILDTNWEVRTVRTCMADSNMNRPDAALIETQNIYALPLALAHSHHYFSLSQSLPLSLFLSLSLCLSLSPYTIGGEDIDDSMSHQDEVDWEEKKK